MSSPGEVERLSDHDLIRPVIALAGREREVTAELLVHLGELDARRLYLAAGCASTFAYCVEVLRISEPATYHRITAARDTARDATAGEVSAANGTGSDSSALLAGVEAVAGDLGERTEQRGRPSQVGPESAGARDARDRSEWDDGGDGAGSREQFAAVKVGAGSPAVAPLRDLRVPVDPEFLDLLDAARDLARHRNPSGDVTTLLRLALQALIQQTESRRRGRAVTATNGDRPSETPGQGEASARGVSVAVVSVQREVAGAPPRTVTEPSGITQACPPGHSLRSR